MYKCMIDREIIVWLLNCWRGKNQVEYLYGRDSSLIELGRIVNEIPIL